MAITSRETGPRLAATRKTDAPVPSAIRRSGGTILTGLDTREVRGRTSVARVDPRTAEPAARRGADDREGRETDGERVGTDTALILGC
ncbi:hypothetical protein RDE2_37240 [Rhodococcus sp. RDE2]|nr:hypothetical protein RDE2_37240 [Rhodococcus sp. RDE2]